MVVPPPEAWMNPLSAPVAACCLTAFVSFPILLVGVPATAPAPAPVPAADPAPAPTPGIPEAMAKVNAGDPAGGVAIMKQVTAREPGNARAWRVLGFAALKAKDPGTAIAAYEKALAIEPGFPT